jgi:tetratricopeptide (TPR) repeat protein
MDKLFISHSTADDNYVGELRKALELHGQDGWVDSRELRGGDLLWPAVQEAIEEASAYAVVVSPAALESKWVGNELRHALKVQKKRGKKEYPVIPLLLNSTKLGVLEGCFKEEPAYIPVTSEAGGIDAAINPILVALGKRLPVDASATPQPEAKPLEELVLELTDLDFHEEDGVRRASARARLVYEPAAQGQPHVHSAQRWEFTAPIGPIEAEDLRWYLEKYAVWPSHYFRDRARAVEENLAKWGRLLHDAALPAEPTANVMQAWATIDGQAGRRFSVHVDASTVAGAEEPEKARAREAATLLLGLPWELLRDGDGFLFQGAKPTRVRRRLPGTRDHKVPVVDPPIRILLVTARPEDEACGYIDHRASALPLVRAMEALGGLVQLHILRPPTLGALGEELDRARGGGEPYHVVHFDGHGVYDRSVGLGGLCFEDPQDDEKLDQRRHKTIFTNELGPLLRDHRIPLVFLEACQTAVAEDASESVASELLQRGVASVIAMSHSVLVETAARFVQAFYSNLAEGGRVGDAMLAGQRKLKDDTFRGRTFGVGELRLEDWFVPVLFQEKDDPQLFRTTPAPQTQADVRAGLVARMGKLPPEPATGFIGRSRELLALERLLRRERYAVVRGQGGEGKTALAAELARWMVRSQQVRRGAFVSVETHSHVGAVLDSLGGQLVPGYSVATFDNMQKALQPVERALVEQSTLVVVDNMESILEPPFRSLALQSRDSEAGARDASTDSALENGATADGETMLDGTVAPEDGPSDTSKNSALESQATGTFDAAKTLSEDARGELDAILGLCSRLNALGDTRLVFTSRESLPAPFDAKRQQRELHRLAREDAVKLVERVLDYEQADCGDAADAARESIEQLVDAVHCHARTLALLAPAIESRGVEATRESLVELMAEMEQKYPGSREQSVFASVELSLQRMSAENQERVQVLGVFHGGVQLGLLRTMMEWEKADVASLAVELVSTGLATPNPYDHLTLNPALCPYLRGKLDDGQRETLTAHWVEAMGAYVEFLCQQRSQNSHVAATLTVLELPNLFALLEHVERAGDGEATIRLTTSLYSLLKNLGKAQLLKRVALVRDAAEAAIGEAWNHARFESQRTRIEQQLAGGQMREAFEDAQQLLERARTAGEGAYRGADYDLAMACVLLARVLSFAGGSEQALPLLAEGQERFETIAKERDSKSAERMASACITERADCLCDLGRLDEAAAGYEEAIGRDGQRGAERDVAVGKFQLGTVRMLQRRHQDALDAFAEARERFAELDEPGSVASSWHQTGVMYQKASQPEAAEDAYRKSLAINVQLGDVAGQASTLGQLGNLYASVLDRSEEAATFYRKAADKHVEIGDVANEGRDRSNLGEALRKLRRFGEARREIRRAIECDAQFGHAAEPWGTWGVLANIETDAGNPGAAEEAKGTAVACYLAYRRDGGENHAPDGRIALAVTQSLLASRASEAAALLQQEAPRFEAAGFLPFIRALQAVVGGSRDRSLADDAGLRYTMAAEVLVLIQTLEREAR